MHTRSMVLSIKIAQGFTLQCIANYRAEVHLHLALHVKSQELMYPSSILILFYYRWYSADCFEY